MTRHPSDLATSAVRSVDALSTTRTSSTIAGICSTVARTPSSSLWHGMTTEMRLRRNMGTPRVWPPRSGGGGRGTGAGSARGQRRTLGLLARDLTPRLAELEARPFLQDGRHHARIEENVDGEEALVGAEALRLADEPARRLGRLAEPDLPEVVAPLAPVAALAVDGHLAGGKVPVGEFPPAEVPREAGNLVLVLTRDLGDQVVAHDALRVDEVG